MAGSTGRKGLYICRFGMLRVIFDLEPLTWNEVQAALTPATTDIRVRRVLLHTMTRMMMTTSGRRWTGLLVNCC